MKKIITIYILIFTSLFAEDNSSMWDITSKSLNSIWEKSKEIGNESWEETKKYTKLGKNLLLEESLTTSMNMSLDTNTTQIKEFKINDDDSIKMVVKLVGEDKDLILDIKQYDWGITEDKKFIVFENIQYDANIKWIKYLLDFYIEKNHGYIAIKHSTTKQSLLFSLKDSIETTYESDKKYAKKYWSEVKKQIQKRWKNSDKKDLTYTFNNILDEEQIAIKNFGIDKDKISANIFLIDTTPIKLTLESFEWATANKRKYIVLKDIKINTNRPWIKGILEKKDNNFHFGYSLAIQKILLSIKPPINQKIKGK